MSLLWSRIYDIIIKSIISVEGPIQAQLRKIHCNHNCFEIFGFDILIDSELKPWLVEVNLSPSLNCDSPLDHSIKAALIGDALTAVGVRRYDRKKESHSRYASATRNKSSSSKSSSQ